MKHSGTMLKMWWVILFGSLLFWTQFSIAAETIIPSALPKYEVTSEDTVWAKPDGTELLARIYRPKLAAGQTCYAVVDVHPGAWNAYDRLAGRLYNQKLAARGLVVVAIDFRQGPAFKHPLASRDVTAAVRFVKINAARLGVNPDRIGLIGSSSGGHLALLAGLKPNDPAHQGTPVVNPENKIVVPTDVDAGVDYIIALWPVSDPYYRLNYAKRANREKLVKAHFGYFGSEDAMKDASIQRVLKDGEAKRIPPVLVVQPGNDKNVPVPMTKELVDAFESKNGSVAYLFYPQQKHAFAHFASEDTEDCINAMNNFIRRQLQRQTKAAK